LIKTLYSVKSLGLSDSVIHVIFVILRASDAFDGHGRPHKKSHVGLAEAGGQIPFLKIGQGVEE
jgi:hypothetical protein